MNERNVFLGHMSTPAEKPPFKEFDKAVDIAYEILVFQKSKGENAWTDSEYRKYFRSIDKLADIILRDGAIKQLLSADDIREFLQSTRAGPRAPDELTKATVASWLKQLTSKVLRYSFFFPLNELVGLPEGYELGACKTQKFTSLPAELKEHLSASWKYLFERDKSIVVRSFEDYKKQKTEQTYLCCEVDAIGYNKAVELAKRLANRSISIYNCLYMSELRPLTEYSFRYDKIVGGGYEERRTSDGWRSHHPIDELEHFSKLVSTMTRSTALSEIEQNVLSAIDVYGLIQRETPIELKFLLSVIALEGLLSAKYDIDFLAWKLREKVALLLGDNEAWIHEYLQRPFEEKVTSEEIEKHRVSARRELASRVAKMYGLRSQFAHVRGSMENEISEKDFRFASFVFRFSMQRVLQLYDKEGIRAVSKSDPKDEEKASQSLDWYLEAMRYSQPLKLD